MDTLHTPEQHNDLGNSLKRAGNVVEAIGHYREALRLRPRWADAHNNLGLALRALGDMPAALEQFRLAVRVRADHVEARNNLEASARAAAAGRAAIVQQRGWHLRPCFKRGRRDSNPQLPDRQSGTLTN
jgi:Flp pilus assembly protein TadD